MEERESILEKFLFVLFGFYLLQTFFAFLQMQHFKKTVKELRVKGIIGIGVKKSKVYKGNVVILVSNKFGQILEAKVMSGFSVFARFKEKKEVCGIHFDELLAVTADKKKEAAMNEALMQIKQQLLVS